jgi:hypothetical protein
MLDERGRLVWIRLGFDEGGICFGYGRWYSERIVDLGWQVIRLAGF